MDNRITDDLWITSAPVSAARDILNAVTAGMARRDELAGARHGDRTRPVPGRGAEPLGAQANRGAATMVAVRRGTPRDTAGHSGIVWDRPKMASRDANTSCARRHGQATTPRLQAGCANNARSALQPGTRGEQE